jgi:hypothetical protein
MATTQTIVKKKRQQAVVVINGTGLANVSMQSLGLADETFDTANVVVNISSVVYSLAANATVSRNGNVVVELNGTDNLMLSQQYGYVLNQGSASNVTVNIAGTVPGSVALEFTKQAGYIEPDQQTKR